MNSFLSAILVTVIQKTNTENWYQRNGVIAVTTPDHMELACMKNLEEFVNMSYKIPRFL
jgi:hypothetical protein